MVCKLRRKLWPVSSSFFLLHFEVWSLKFNQKIFCEKTHNAQACFIRQFDGETLRFSVCLHIPESQQASRLKLISQVEYIYARLTWNSLLKSHQFAPKNLQVFNTTISDKILGVMNSFRNIYYHYSNPARQHNFHYKAKPMVVFSLGRTYFWQQKLWTIPIRAWNYLQHYMPMKAMATELILLFSIVGTPFLLHFRLKLVVWWPYFSLDAFENLLKGYNPTPLL